MNTCLTSIPKHTIIQDYIDIDLDTSKQIFYCTKCFATFTNIHGNISFTNDDHPASKPKDDLCSSTTYNT